ncbi:MAG: TetR/AcrR family transcriptional regulator [Anaerolineaceae bacterium]|nr:TetR/AcrR family transcriptional regulator [Anaerolineaceae bacterium]
MTTTRRERIRETTLEEIISTAWKQIAEQGVPALSLRAIAREMGMTAPGLYRYYPSRDDLVTALIKDAFDSFTRHLETARDEAFDANHVEQYRAVCLAYYQWAVLNPSRYALIFGSPVPGYQMTEAAYASSRKGFLVLQNLIEKARAAGSIHPPADFPPLPPELVSRYESLRILGMPGDPVGTHIALATWSTLHGVTALMLYGYLEGFLSDQVEGFVLQMIDQLVMLFGFE